MRTALILIAIAGFGDVATAGQVSQTRPFAFGAANEASSVSLMFKPFDTRDGSQQLVAVYLEYAQTVACGAQAENEGDAPAPDLGLEVVSMGSASVGGHLFAAGSAFAFVPSGGVGPADGEPGQGADYFDFGVQEQQLGGEDLVMADPTVAAAFLGGGVEATLTLNCAITATGGPNIDLTIERFCASGYVTLTYVYETAPSGPGLSAWPLAGACLGVRRRQDVTKK